ncbi:unnamed protein product [Schistosoma turkestanicum]|nr:unnamed protein product [Schistosoma turkestanicum]
MCIPCELVDVLKRKAKRKNQTITSFSLNPTHLITLISLYICVCLCVCVCRLEEAENNGDHQPDYITRSVIIIVVVGCLTVNKVNCVSLFFHIYFFVYSI